MFSNLPNLKLVHKWALAYFCSPGNTAHRCVHFKLCWGCQCTGLWLCYHSRADSTQEVSFRTQTPSDPEHQGTSIFARLHPSTTSCISFPKRFSQHGTKWEKRLGPRAPKIHCIEASWKATCVYSSKRISYREMRILLRILSRLSWKYPHFSRSFEPSFTVKS